jgi:hypothetical protein
MADRTPDPTPAIGGVNKRRVLIAGAGAAFAATLAKFGTPGAALANNGQPLTLGQSNSASNDTQLNTAGGGSLSTAAFYVQASGQNGTAAAPTAIRGDGASGQGVAGFSQANGTGVLGQSVGSTGGGIGVGVNGTSQGGGYGGSFSAGSGAGLSTGVQGVLIGAGTAGVYGQATANTTTGAYGVWGRATGNFAVRGDGIGQPAVFGSATANNSPVVAASFAVWGQTNTAGSAGASAILGENQGTGDGVRGQSLGGPNQGAAIHGITQGGGNAGLFDGAVQVNGNLTATGNLNVLGTKSAVVQTNGQFRKVFCQEAPSAWFEDFGEGQLVNGRAVIAIEPTYRGTVATADASRPYHVFLTSHSADVESLAVTQRNADNFVVEANGKGLMSGSFSYRIVASRADRPYERLPIAQPELASPERVQSQLDSLPKLPTPPPPPLPQAPTLSKP